MKRRGFHLVVAVLAVCLHGVDRVRTGRRREHDRVHQRQGRRHQRRRAAGRDRDGDQPVGDGRADIGHRHGRQLPLSGAASRHLHGDVRAARVQHAEAREHPDLDGLHGHRQRRARGRVAAGNGDGHRRFAGHRHLLDARPAELQARSAAGNPELARPVVAAGGDAVGARWGASTSAATAPARRPATPPTATAARIACSSRASTRRKARPAPASTSTTARSKRSSSARSRRAPRCRPRACRARCSASRAATSSRARSTRTTRRTG